MKSTYKNKAGSGFTIIEVILVLAIAGLIFLMVFIALPALQRSQRNTQRRNDVALVLSQINDYQTSNGGLIPTKAAAFGTFLTNYLGADFKAPNGSPYKVSATNTLADLERDNFLYVPEAKCNSTAANGVYETGAGSRSAAVVIRLENSQRNDTKSGPYFCQDNQ